MLCEHCHAQPATVFLTTVIGGKSTRQQFCQTCAVPVFARMPPAPWTSYAPPEDSTRELPEQPAGCPAEVFLTDPVSINDLAKAFHVYNLQIAAVLMEHGIFKNAEESLDFAQASLVCQHYRVTPHKVV